MVILVLCTIVTGLAVDGPLEIDFRSVRVRPPALEFVGGSGTGGGIGGTGTAIEPPLTVTIVNTESAACENAQRYASVKLLNNSSNPMVLPWAPDGSKVILAKVGEAQIDFETLSVTFRSKKKPDMFVMQELFGRAAVPTSRVKLLPGKSAFLRNIALPHSKDVLCGQDIAAEISMFSSQATKSSKGYLLNSQERWRVRSR